MSDPICPSCTIYPAGYDCGADDCPGQRTGPYKTRGGLLHVPVPAGLRTDTRLGLMELLGRVPRDLRGPGKGWKSKDQYEQDDGTRWVIFEPTDIDQ